jgi:arylsulfatase
MGAKISEWDPDQDVWELYNLTKDFLQANDLSAAMPRKLRALQDTFTMQATENKVFPIGGAFYMSALHPEEVRASALRAWIFYPGQMRIPESMAPKFVSGLSSHAVVEATVPAGTSGVLFCVGGLAGGFTVYMDEDVLCAEYNTLGGYRYKARAQGPIAAGAVQIEVELLYEARIPQAPADIVLRVAGAEVARGRVERSVPAGFTASETFISSHHRFENKHSFAGGEHHGTSRIHCRRVSGQPVQRRNRAGAG